MVNTCGKTSERENMRADCKREVQTLFLVQIFVYLLVLKAIGNKHVITHFPMLVKPLLNCKLFSVSSLLNTIKNSLLNF